MTGLRPLWIDGLPVAIPDDSKVVHLAGQKLALVAVPRWTVHVMTSGGVIAAPDPATNEAMIASYFPSLAPESSSPSEATRF